MNTERRSRLFEDPVSLSLSFSSESSIEISRRIIPFISQLGPLIVNREENVARRKREEGRSSKLWRTAENGRGNHLLQFKALSRVAFFLLDSYIYLSLRPRRAILLSFHPSSPRIERWRTLSKYEERKSLRIIFHLLEETLEGVERKLSFFLSFSNFYLVRPTCSLIVNWEEVWERIKSNPSSGIL